MEALAADPGGVRRPTPASTPADSEHAFYSRVVVRVPDGTVQFQRDYQVTGDTLFVEELVGRKLAYIRFGSHTNPFVPLVERATYRRRFDRFTILLHDDSVSALDDNLGEFRAALVVSTGDFITMPEESDSLAAGFLCRRGTATTAVASVFAGALSAGGQVPSIGKRGGLFTIVNTDDVNELYFRYGVPSATPAVDASFFVLQPGQAYDVPLKQLISQAGEQVVVGTTSGTCSFQFLGSPGAYDRIDPGQVTPVTP